MIRIWLIFSVGILLLSAPACTHEDHSSDLDLIEKLDNVKNESVISSLSNMVKDSVNEDVIVNAGAKQKAEKLKTERVEKLTQKVNSSKYKGYSDEQIKENLGDQLENYVQSCDSLIINAIFDEMAFDAVLSFFKQRQSDFCQDYFKNLQKAKKQCKSSAS